MSGSMISPGPVLFEFRRVAHPKALKAKFVYVIERKEVDVSGATP